jgi:putative transposase
MLLVRMFKYRVYPSLKQRIQLTRSCIAARELWNEMRERRKSHYEATGETLRQYDLNKEFKGKAPELHSQVRQEVAARLEKAFDAFFRCCKDPSIKKKGYPKHKKRCNSITYPQSGFKFESEKRLVVSKIGRVPIVLHRVPKGTIKTLTLKRDRAGDWWAVFSCEMEMPEPPKHEGSEVGLDLGLLHFATMSDGTTIENPRWFRNAEQRLSRLQRRVSRKQKGGVNRRKARRLLARQHIKVVNQRADFQFKEARKLALKHKLIVVEDLRVKNMMRNRCLAKSIGDASWGGFLAKLDYQAVMAGSSTPRVAAAYSTLTCSGCGHVKDELPLDERTYECAECGLVLDRDVNAAKYILKKHLSTVGLDRPEPNACGQRTSTAAEHSAAASPLEEAGTIRDET